MKIEESSYITQCEKNLWNCSYFGANIFSKQNKEGDRAWGNILHICYYGFFGGWIIKLQRKSHNQTNVNTFLIRFINWNSKRRSWKNLGFIGFSHA